MQFPAKIGLFIVLSAIVLFGIQSSNKIARQRAQSTEARVPQITNVATKSESSKKTVGASKREIMHKIVAKHRASSKQRPQANRNSRQTLTDPASKHAKLVGKHISLGTPGKWTVVHFWATWCGACVEASPDLVKLHAKYAPHGIEFFGVNLDKEPEAMGKYMSKVGMAWPQMVTAKGWESHVRIEHEVPSIPAVYLVSPTGQVVEAGIRGFADGEARLRHHLTRGHQPKSDLSSKTTRR